MLVSDASALIDFIYPDIDSPNAPPPDYFLNRMILAPQNSDVADLNDIILDRMAGDAQV